MEAANCRDMQELCKPGLMVKKIQNSKIHIQTCQKRGVLSFKPTSYRESNLYLGHVLVYQSVKVDRGHELGTSLSLCSSFLRRRSLEELRLREPDLLGEPLGEMLLSRCMRSIGRKRTCCSNFFLRLAFGEGWSSVVCAGCDLLSKRKDAIGHVFSGLPIDRAELL